MRIPFAAAICLFAASAFAADAPVDDAAFKKAALKNRKRSADLFVIATQSKPTGVEKIRFFLSCAIPAEILLNFFDSHYSRDIFYL